MQKELATRWLSAVIVTRYWKWFYYIPVLCTVKPEPVGTRSRFSSTFLVKQLMITWICTKCGGRNVRRGNEFVHTMHLVLAGCCYYTLVPEREIESASENNIFYISITFLSAPIDLLYFLPTWAFRCSTLYRFGMARTKYISDGYLETASHSPMHSIMTGS